MVDKDEKLSAFIDNELPDSRFVNDLMDDSQQASKWQRYHFIGDVLRGEQPQALQLDLADSIAQAIDNEAPHHSLQSANDESSSSLKPRKNNDSIWSRWFHGAGQYAIAASVAVVAILGVQRYQQSPEMPISSSSQPMQVLDTVPIGGTVAPVSLHTQVAERSSQLTEKQWLEQRKEIAAYLQDHQIQQRH